MKITAAALALALLMGCGASAPAEPTIGKYQQTWTKSYASTTCSDWVDRMNAHERFVMAGDMLLGAQRSQFPETPLPPDVQINRMRDAIHEVCSGDAADLGLRVSEIAASLYVMADVLKPGQ